MSSLELGYNQLGENYGYYIDKAPQNVLEELGQQINELQADFSKGKKHNNNLAGEIEHEYNINIQPQTKQYIKDLTQRFENESQYIVSNYNLLPTLGIHDDMWINFQKKYEYNPIHDHYGVYSFVIWYQIPYTKENEAKYNYKSAEDRRCVHGGFSFISYNKETHRIEDTYLPVDKSKQGYVAIFPSNLNHMVYPFYSSEEYRITVAGNIKVYSE